jgi:hypothetical protein
MSPNESAAEARRPRLSVVIPTYERPERVAALVASLDAQTLPPSQFEVIVVDDGSRVDPRPALEAIRRRSTSCSSATTNQGAGAARHRGIELARADRHLFLDDDMIPSPALLAEHLAVHEATPRAVVVGCLRSEPGVANMPIVRALPRVRKLEEFASRRCDRGALAAGQRDLQRQPLAATRRLPRRRRLRRAWGARRTGARLSPREGGRRDALLRRRVHGARLGSHGRGGLARGPPSSTASRSSASAANTGRARRGRPVPLPRATSASSRCPGFALVDRGARRRTPRRASRDGDRRRPSIGSGWSAPRSRRRRSRTAWSTTAACAARRARRGRVLARSATYRARRATQGGRAHRRTPAAGRRRARLRALRRAVRLPRGPRDAPAERRQVRHARPQAVEPPPRARRAHRLPAAHRVSAHAAAPNEGGAPTGAKVMGPASCASSTAPTSTGQPSSRTGVSIVHGMGLAIVHAARIGRGAILSHNVSIGDGIGSEDARVAASRPSKRTSTSAPAPSSSAP